MSALKKLVPAAIRDQLRPLVRSIEKGLRRCVDSLKAVPADWQALKQKMQREYSSAELYHISQEAFGVLQQEVEITGVLDYIAAASPNNIGEIGLKHSGNSFLFTQKCRKATLFLGLDLKLENTEKLQYIAPAGMQFRFFEGSSYAPQTVEQVRRFLNGRQFDFLFIDGDHSYHGVKEDFLMYLPMVRPGGLVGFHDIVPDDVARHGVKPEQSKCYGGDVHVFWAQLKAQFEHKEFVRSWDQTGFGIGIITLPSTALTPQQIADLHAKLVSPTA